MTKKPKNFKDAAAYKKWVTYIHMHPEVNTPGNTPVKIQGKSHKVDHTK